jgi:predicted HicB family RNase H-like nuclease
VKKTKRNDRYTYRVTWSEEDQEHVGLCAEYPSLSWLAASPEAALRGIRMVVAEVIEDMQASGEAAPEPLALRHFSGKFMVRVPPEVHRQLAVQAAEEGISLNRLASAKLS